MADKAPSFCVLVRFTLHPDARGAFLDLVQANSATTPASQPKAALRAGTPTN